MTKRKTKKKLKKGIGARCVGNFWPNYSVWYGCAFHEILLSYYVYEYTSRMESICLMSDSEDKQSDEKIDTDLRRTCDDDDDVNEGHASLFFLALFVPPSLISINFRQPATYPHYTGKNVWILSPLALSGRTK